MKPLILRKPSVDRDIDECFDFIAQDKIEPAERFLKVAAESFERLALMPGIGAEWESTDPLLEDVCMYPMPRPFRNYLVFYRPINGGIEVLAVLHGALDLTNRIGGELERRRKE